MWLCVYASDVGVRVGGWLCMAMSIICVVPQIRPADILRLCFGYVVVHSRTACEMKHTLKVEPTGR